MKKLFTWYFLLSFILITCFVFKFQYDKNIIIGHLIFSGFIHLAFIYISYLCFGKFLSNRTFFVLYFYFYFSLWTVFYLLIFVSNAEWSDTIPFKMARDYIKDLPKLLETLPYSRRLYLEAFLFQVVFAVGLHYVIYPSKKISLGSQLNKCLELFKSLRFPYKLTIGLVSFLFVLLSGYSLLKTKRFYHMLGEPLTKFFYGYMWGTDYKHLYDFENIALDKIDEDQKNIFKADTALGNRKNVIIILVDALRADNLSVYGYNRHTMPCIDSLLSTGRAIKIENVYSTTNSTLGGLSSLFLSKTWKHVSVKGFGLVEALKLKNYTTYGILSGYQKYWYSLAASYQKHMSFLKDGTDSKKYSIDDDRTVMDIVSQLPIHDHTPSFFYFHLMSLHNLGFVQDSFHVYLPDQVNNFLPNEQNKQLFYNDYDNRILQVNSIVNYILKTLQDKGYLKNAVVLITSDHGQSLGEGGRDGHGAYLQREAIRIPLIIMDDSVSLYKNTQLARQVDIAPPILKRLQLPVPAAWEGHSLLDTLKPGISFHENATWRFNRLYGFIQNDSSGIYRYMFNSDFTNQSLYKI